MIDYTYEEAIFQLNRMLTGTRSQGEVANIMGAIVRHHLEGSSFDKSSHAIDIAELNGPAELIQPPKSKYRITCKGCRAHCESRTKYWNCPYCNHICEGVPIDE